MNPWLTRDFERRKKAASERAQVSRLRRRNWPRVVEWSHARVELRPQSKAADCFRGKSVSLQNEVSRVAVFRVVPAIFRRVTGHQFSEDPRKTGIGPWTTCGRDLRARNSRWQGGAMILFWSRLRICDFLPRSSCNRYIVLTNRKWFINLVEIFRW